MTNGVNPGDARTGAYCKNHCLDVHDLGKKIDGKLSTKIGLWIIGIVLMLLMAGAGTFAIAQRSTIAAQNKAMEQQGAAIRRAEQKAAETDKRFEIIQGQVNSINVHLEYIKDAMQEQQRRAGRDSGP